MAPRNFGTHAILTAARPCGCRRHRIAQRLDTTAAATTTHATASRAVTGRKIRETNPGNITTLWDGDRHFLYKMFI